MAAEQPLKGVRVLIAEDEGLVAEVIRIGLEDAGCIVTGVVADGTAAIEAAIKDRPDLILMDVGLKGRIDGIQAAELIHRRISAPVVYLTGHSDTDTLQRANASSAYGFVLKPFRLDNLVAAVDVAMARFRTDEHLEQVKLTYATILESVSDAIVTTDTGGRVRFMNAVAERLTGWLINEAQGCLAVSVMQFTNIADEAKENHPLARALCTGAKVALGPDEHVVSRSGDRVPVDGAAQPVKDSLGRLVGATITLRDVTEMRQARAALQDMAERLRVVVDTAVDGVMLLDASGNILMFNPACVRLFGLSREEAAGRNAQELLQAPLTDDFGRPLGSGLGRRAGIRLDSRPTRGRHADGSSFPAELSVGETSYDGRAVFACVVHDTSERERIDAAVVAAIDGERRRFIHDLHEGVAQDIAGLSLLLAALNHSARAEKFTGASDLEQAADIAAKAIASCRQIASALSPIDEAHGGLVAGLRRLVERTEEGPNQSIEFAALGSAAIRLEPAAANHLYRIAEEALTNSRIHANASSIKLTVDIDPAQVQLRVCDDGDGFRDPELVGKHLGLRTMQFRATAIGAQLSIESKPGGGTCIDCVCPQSCP